jgi:hypothetical protein
MRYYDANEDAWVPVSGFKWWDGSQWVTDSTFSGGGDYYFVVEATQPVTGPGPEANFTTLVEPTDPSPGFPAGTPAIYPRTGLATVGMSSSHLVGVAGSPAPYGSEVFAPFPQATPGLVFGTGVAAVGEDSPRFRLILGVPAPYGPMLDPFPETSFIDVDDRKGYAAVGSSSPHLETEGNP